MCKILKDVGVRDVNEKVMREKFFTPNEYMAHFEKVPSHRFERTVKKIDELKYNSVKAAVCCYFCCSIL